MLITFLPHFNINIELIQNRLTSTLLLRGLCWVLWINKSPWDGSSDNIVSGCKLSRWTFASVTSDAFLFIFLSLLGEFKHLHLLKRSQVFSFSIITLCHCSIVDLSAISLNLARSEAAFSNFSRSRLHRFVRVSEGFVTIVLLLSLSQTWRLRKC